MTRAIWSIGCDALQKACTVLTNYRELPILAIDSDPWRAACRFDNLYHSRSISSENRARTEFLRTHEFYS